MTTNKSQQTSDDCRAKKNSTYDRIFVLTAPYATFFTTEIDLTYEIKGEKRLSNVSIPASWAINMLPESPSVPRGPGR